MFQEVGGLILGFREGQWDLSSGLSQPGGNDAGDDTLVHDTGSFTGASCNETVQDIGERGTDDLCSCVHCPLEVLAVCCTTVPIPDNDAAGQHALNTSPVESGGAGWRETCSFQPADKV